MASSSRGGRTAFTGCTVLLLAATIAFGLAPSTSQGRGPGKCRGAASLPGYFDLAAKRKLKTKRASCKVAKRVSSKFARSCAGAYSAQGRCRVRAAGRWRCRSGMLGKLSGGAPARVKCRKRKGRVSFVVGYFPPTEPHLGGPAAQSSATTPPSAGVARAPSPAWNRAAGCIETSTPGQAVGPPDLANFQLRVVGGLPLAAGERLQRSIIAHNDWAILNAGLGAKPRNEPARLPILLSSGDLPGKSYGVKAATCSNGALDAVLIGTKFTDLEIDETAMHELFHAFSGGLFDATVGGVSVDTWWEEASATWSQAKAGYREDPTYDRDLQFPNEALDIFQSDGTYQYAMSRFVQFLEDRGYVTNGSSWPLQRAVIAKYPDATAGLDQALRARQTNLGEQAAAFWGDRIRERPLHGPQLVVGAEGTRSIEIDPGAARLPPAVERLHTRMLEFTLTDDVSRVEFEFEAPPGGYFWAAVENNVSRRVDGETIAFCVKGEGDGGELKWPTTLPVTFTNGRLEPGPMTGEIEVRAQRDPGQCKETNSPTNRACQILAEAGASSLFGPGQFPFYNSFQDRESATWICFYVGEAGEVNLNLVRRRTGTTRQVRDTVRAQIRALNMREVNVGDLAGIVTENVDGKLADIMTIASGREIVFLIVGLSNQNRTIRLGKRIVGQID